MSTRSKKYLYGVTCILQTPISILKVQTIVIKLPRNILFFMNEIPKFHSHSVGVSPSSVMVYSHSYYFL